MLDSGAILVSFPSTKFLKNYRKKPLLVWLSWVERCWGFGSQSGHMPGLWIHSLVGARMGGNQSAFLSHISACLSLSLPSSRSQIYKHILKSTKNTEMLM